jgi:sugar/nucleoside kinase (ribokinase family)
MKKVTVVGSLNIDHVLKVEKLPLKGETIYRY